MESLGGIKKKIMDEKKTENVSNYLEERLKRETYQREKLLETAHYLTASLDVKEVLTRIGVEAREMLKAQGATIYHIENGGEILTPVVAIRPSYEGEIHFSNYNVPNSILRRAKEEKKALIFNNVKKDTLKTKYSERTNIGNKSIIVAPFIVNEKVIGAIYLDRSLVPFSEEELTLVETFATYAAIALKNTQTYYNLHREIKERKRIEAKLRQVRDELEIRVKERTAELMKINELMIKEIAERKRTKEILKQSFDKLRRTLKGTVNAMAMIVEAKDPYTAGHQLRVAKLASAIAKAMGFTKEKVEEVRLAGLLHDIGKITVPSEILSRPKSLTEAEYSIIKTHPEIGYDILKTIEFPWPIAEIVLQHHERLDGSGYPSGIEGKDILPEAKILAVADVVEAMSSNRPYREARGIDKALDEIEKNKGVLYDIKVVDTCLKLFTERGFSFEQAINEMVGEFQ